MYKAKCTYVYVNIHIYIYLYYRVSGLVVLSFFVWGVICTKTQTLAGSHICGSWKVYTLPKERLHEWQLFVE